MEVWKNDDGTFGATMSRDELRFIYRLLYDVNCAGCPVEVCVCCADMQTNMLLALTED